MVIPVFDCSRRSSYVRAEAPSQEGRRWLVAEKEKPRCVTFYA
jgi:hypothetical protein